MDSQSTLSTPMDGELTSADVSEIVLAQTERNLKSLFARHGIDFDGATDKPIDAVLDPLLDAIGVNLGAMAEEEERRERMERQQDEFFGGHPDSDTYCSNQKG